MLSTTGQHVLLRQLLLVGGGFKHVFIFTPIWEDFQLDQYFSNGSIHSYINPGRMSNPISDGLVQPPTSCCLMTDFPRGGRCGTLAKRIGAVFTTLSGGCWTLAADQEGLGKKLSCTRMSEELRINGW